jgi:asparagine synthase (glutamine-hydrolysing)
MCGIAGIVGPTARDRSELLQIMLQQLRHRGPDASGILLLDGCGLGHSRLTIVDLNTGDQPMPSADRQTAVTFNGEIYGYKTIRSRLKGYPFRTSSDTEVILALYSLHGKRLMPYLPGMFAFALWDNRNKELFCARDRFGEKPFYFAFGPGREFLFASEIKAIVSTGMVKPVLSRTGLIHYLRQLYVAPFETIYENVYVLPPAHTLSYKDGRLIIERYWDLPSRNDTMNYQDAEEQFTHLLEQAISRQLVADVPVSAFLSGGLDSSTIVAVASQYNPHLQTLSCGFETNMKDVRYAREVADLYRTNHSEVLAETTELGDLLVRMQAVYDEPFADSSNIPTFVLCQLARRHGKVTITGDGADEILAGYDYWYRPLVFMEEERNRKSGLFREILFRFLAKAARRFHLPIAKSLQYRRNGIVLSRRYRSVSEAHRAQKVYFTDDELSELFLDWRPRSEPPQDPSTPPADALDDALRLDLKDYLPGDILTKIDRASMANSLELRAPFLDVDLASFCIALPSSLKINRDTDKLLLRKAFSRRWPVSLRSRDKQGFGAPVDEWLKKPSIKRLRDQYLNQAGSKIFHILSFEKSRRFVQRDSYQTWILLVLSLWMEAHDFTPGDS